MIVGSLLGHGDHHARRSSWATPSRARSATRPAPTSVPIDETRARRATRPQLDAVHAAITTRRSPASTARCAITSVGAVVGRHGRGPGRRAQPPAIVELDFDAARQLRLRCRHHRAGRRRRRRPTGDEVGDRRDARRQAARRRRRSDRGLRLRRLDDVHRAPDRARASGWSATCRCGAGSAGQGQPHGALRAAGHDRRPWPQGPTAAGGGSRPTTEIVVSNTGGVFDSAAAVRRRSATSSRRAPTRSAASQVIEAKAELLDQAQAQGELVHASCSRPSATSASSPASCCSSTCS